ncbi:putative receptor-like protein kinase At3g47110 [Syzygium oleosum]|uniref:putative receptor-like protein kinase At3g47110 n=1 Tax=Syzygium oleosum TaxID=219896 RepID=UPI0024B9C2D9|nr:putative receptor-like protein kinase At3g47110 [Syzygium oleosum]
MSSSHSCSVTFPAVLILELVITSFASCSALGSETDKIALQEFRSLLTDNAAGTLASWNDSLHFCQWTGVTCGLRHQRVAALNLDGWDLAGTVSPYIGNLSFLRYLNLANNSFHGLIPPEIGHLFRLKNLILSHNTFGGGIPRNLSLCLSLMTLELDNNHLHDPIPPEFGSLSKLQKLSLSNNNLTGLIPASIGNLSTLEELNLWSNNLTGGVPISIGQTRLKIFMVGENQLTGGFPSALYNLSSLDTIILTYNLFYGSIRRDIGLLLPNLQILYLAGNQFNGLIPDSLSNATNIAAIDMPSNNFSGRVPASFGGLQNLSWLNLEYNFLGSGSTGGLSFLADLANCSNLEMLDLQYNQFEGELPVSVSNFSTQLQQLQMSGNRIRGRIPEVIANLFSLQLLSMDDNMLTGNIPMSIGRLSNLQYLSLGQNKLTGHIPSTIGNITGLIFLYLYNNSLEGIIPSSLGNCKALQDLRLCHNKFTGTISSHMIRPSSLIINLNVSHNSLSGPMTPDVGNLKNIISLDVSYNQISGEIPTTLGNCLGFEELYMQANHFRGPIPQFTGLKGIRFLDLSNNNLSGQIPEFLVNLSSSLQLLNLSFNNLEGEVPVRGIFGNTSAFKVDGNDELCGGIPELHLPSCPAKSFPRSVKHRSVKRLMVIIICASCAVALLFLASLFRLRNSKKEHLPTRSLGHFHESISYDALFKATDGFCSSKLIGSGSFGNVYRGTLGLDGKIVAIKVLNLQQKGAFKGFLAECKALSGIRHRNLVKILTACSSIDSHRNEFKALVYEFMVNGNLDTWLHPNDKHMQFKPLSFLQRLNIAIDVASALDYLHHQCRTPIIHCDLKPSNILLDDDFTAHISDFGLSRLIFESNKDIVSSHLSSSAFKGTMGYIAPEYGMGVRPSTSGDVYSFGILLLEMFTGRRPTDDIFKEDFNLQKFVKSVLSKRATGILDQSIFCGEVGESWDNEGNWSDCGIDQAKCLISVFEIGLICSAESPKDRKDINRVALDLLSIRDKFLKTGIHEDRIQSPAPRDRCEEAA